MSSKIAFTLACLSLLISSPAFATDSSIDCGKVDGKWMSQDEVKDKATELGYDVRQVKIENNCYEVYAINNEDQRVEIFMNPVSGEVVTIKKK